MRDYSKIIIALYSMFDRSSTIRAYTSRGYSIERKQPLYGRHFNKYTFALKNGQEITFTKRGTDADANLISQIASVIRKFDLLLDFCSGSIVAENLSYYRIDDNYSGELNYPEGIDSHFWLHPSCEGDNYENGLFVNQTREDACLQAFCNNPRRLSFPHSLLIRNPSGKMKMFLYSERSDIFFVFSPIIFSVELLEGFFDIITEISNLDLQGTDYSWDHVHLFARKAKFADRPTPTSIIPPEPVYYLGVTDLIPGDKVQHTSFGEGTVKQIIAEKGHVVVDFLSAGEKTIALHYGKLQKIDNDEK